MANKIKIVVSGALGRMGSEAVKLVDETDHFELVAGLDISNEGKLIADVPGQPDIEAPIYTDIEKCFSEVSPDVMIDFTNPEVGRLNTETAIKHGVRPVVGTSGFTDQSVSELSQLADEHGTGAMIAPNFALGAVLMMKFSQMAAKYMPDVEIIETHHDQKLDAPSGTAVKTAEMIAKVREQKQQGHPDEEETITGARGAVFNDFRIHSIRLPGHVAHQEVIFGGEGETLKIRHDSIHRKSFMSGVKLAVDTVMTLDQLVYGLDHILE